MEPYGRFCLLVLNNMIAISLRFIKCVKTIHCYPVYMENNLINTLLINIYVIALLITLLVNYRLSFATQEVRK